MSREPIPLLAVGGRGHELSAAELGDHLDRIAGEVVAGGVRRVLVVPPDHTRLHSRGGTVAAHLDRALRAQGVDVDLMPALGTHRPLGPEESRMLFGDGIRADRLLEHRWRDDVTTIGEIEVDEVDAIVGRPLGLSLPVTVNSALVGGAYDLVVAAGQVVPHEVAGFGGYTKHLCIGLGGRDTIQRTHLISAVYGIEETLGRVDSPVRRLIDLGFDRFLAPRCRTLFVLTVVEAAGEGGVLRGLFAGEGGTGSSGGAAFAAAAEFSADVNITTVPEPFEVCVAYLHPMEFPSTWLANKAIYRTRLAMADGGELVVLAPGVDRFGEDEVVDALIRRHGYRGRDAALRALKEDPELAANLAAVAHLIHGSTEGRFTVRYCPGPGLGRADIEGVGFEYLSAEDAHERFGAGSRPELGPGVDRDGRPFVAIPNAGLGLWRQGGSSAASGCQPE
ncbi:MAG: lactate racemase domain-containing protein [Gaiellaceae bacterium]